MNGFLNKRLLILGANVTETFIVRRAQELGIYVIVTDNNTDKRLSPAKKIADESWDISWSDVDALEKKCRENNIDGIIAGFSEFRVENQIKLCNRLNLPCTITARQLEITRDKVKFKVLCKISGLPIVPEYEVLPDQVPPLPVIVKPVDRAGSIGISVASTEQEYRDSVIKALEASPTKSVIVEKYMEGYTKFDLYYLIVNGEVMLIGSNDTLMCPPVKGHEILQAAWVFPSKHENAFVHKHGSAISAFFKNLNVQNGYITFSAFVDSDDNFYMFEAGFRLSGELSFIYGDYAYGFNYLDELIAYSLGIPDTGQKYYDKINTNRMLVINHFATDGDITEAKGLEYNGGAYITYDYLHQRDKLKNIQGNGVSKIAMSFIPIISSEQALNAVESINSSLYIAGKYGQSLIYHKISNRELKNFLK